jgi:hypothetical protein
MVSQSAPLLRPATWKANRIQMCPRVGFELSTPLAKNNSICRDVTNCSPLKFN